ncbi:uncharacterized protein [Asterias amurensis]|uniref:uncharacterized protein n=1 Tax=Asterias amurensis TaxID=7602 RepID=UPI003AB56A76
MSNTIGRSKQATVHPFIKPAKSVPIPPSSLQDISSSQSFQDNDDEGEISASQLFRQSNFKVPIAPRGILKRTHQSVREAFDEDNIFGSQSLFEDDDPKPSRSDIFNNDYDDSQRSEGHQQLLSQVEDVIPSSQPTRHGQRFIPSFTPKRVRISDSVTSSQRSSQDNYGDDSQATVTDSPYTLAIPGYATPGGTTHSGTKLRSVNEIPTQYRCVFPFPYFNIVQSKVLDDVLHTDKHMVVCAPTGSGKTAIFELAIVRLLTALGANAIKSKVVYMAPIKALCSQRCQDWKDKFEPLGLKCQELTGDTEIDDYFQLQEINIVLTTPEKWDSMTRKWRDNKSLVQLVKLFLIDEVHSLNEENRGATVEAVISRMKTVQAAAAREATTTEKAAEGGTPDLRFLAVSATIPNIEDVAEWLKTDGKSGVFHKLDESHRPVKLRKVVLSYPCSDRQSEFRFDLSLNYKLGGVIHTYSDQKPTLVFCATRKGVQQAASILIKEARFIMNGQHKQRLQKVANMIRETKLRELLLSGVGYHHAGLDAQDRKITEELFISGDLPVLIATSTLAMGVNLPAHLVVVKSTQHYISGMYCEYTETQVLQMIGRAGRPQFDTSATAVIMTKHESKKKYLSLLNGADDIESSLHNHLIEHLNAEIVLHTINDISIALEWLKSTFLYIRIMKNPSHYKIPANLTKEQMETKLQDICIRDLNLLSNFGLVTMDAETMDLKPTETGQLMARYCIAFDTMKQFSAVVGTESMEEILTMLCKCKEFADIQLRVNERKVLNTLNKDKNRVTIRFPMKGKIKTTDMKVNCLIQSVLGCLPIQDFGLTQDTNRIFRAGQRLTRCLLEYLMQKTNFKALLHAAMISKCFKARLWENSKNVARQLDKIGPALGTALVNAGITNFQKVESTNPRELELILNRHPPFGNLILDAVTHLPKYDVSIEQAPRYNTQSAEITLTIGLMNQESLAKKRTAKTYHGCMLLIGDADNKVVFKQRIMDSQLVRSGAWSKKIYIKRAKGAEQLSVNLISQDYVGLDVQSSYTPFYSGPKHMQAITTERSHPTPLQPKTNTQEHVKRRQPAMMNSWQGYDNDLNTDDEDLSEYGNRKPCNHHCSNKDSCAHECCKFGIPIKQSKPKEEMSSQRSTVSTTPSASGQPARSSRLDQYFSDLHAKLDVLPQTPSVKRLKAKQGSNTCNVDLDRFSFTPQSKTVIPSSSSSSSTPSLMGTPRTPAAPQSAAKGWEMLDMYQQTRCQGVMMEEAEDQVRCEDSLPIAEEATPWVVDKRNIEDGDMSWSDTDLEDFFLESSSKVDPVSSQSFNESNKQPWDMASYKQPNQASATLHPQQQNTQHQLSNIFKPASVNRQHLLLGQQPTARVLEAGRSATSTNQLKQPNPHQRVLTPFKQASANKQPFDPQLGQQPMARVLEAASATSTNQLKPNPSQRVLNPFRQTSSSQPQFGQHPQMATFKSAPINQHQQEKPDPRQQNSTTFKQASGNQYHDPQQQQSDINKSAPSATLHPQPHGQYRGMATQPCGSLSESVRRRGQVFAWKSPISKQPTEDTSVVSSPPMGLRPMWPSSNKGAARQAPSTDSSSRANEFRTAKSALASCPASSNTNTTKTCISKSPVFQHQMRKASRQDQPVDMNEDQHFSISSDEELSLDSNQYTMNSSSDEEFLNSCLQVEFQEAINVRSTPGKFQRDCQAVSAPVSHQKKHDELIRHQPRRTAEPKLTDRSPLHSQITHPNKRPDIHPIESTSADKARHTTSIQQSRRIMNPSKTSDIPAPAQRHGFQPSHKPVPFGSQESNPHPFLPSQKNQSPLSSVTAVSLPEDDSTQDDAGIPGSMKLMYSPEISPTTFSPPLVDYGQMSPASLVSKNPPDAISQSQSSDAATPRPSSRARQGGGLPKRWTISPRLSDFPGLHHISSPPSRQLKNHSPKLSLGSPPEAILHSTPTSSKSGSALWRRQVCSPLLRRQKTRNFFSAVPNHSPEAADDAQAVFDQIFQGIF